MNPIRKITIAVLILAAAAWTAVGLIVLLSSRNAPAHNPHPSPTVYTPSPVTTTYYYHKTYDWDGIHCADNATNKRVSMSHCNF